MNAPMVFMVFIILRVFYFLSFKYKISHFFQEYSFKLFFIVMLMEGNLESFSYYFIFDCLNLHHHNPFQKCLNFLTLFCFFCFCWYVASWYFIIKVTEKEDSKYFFGNYHSNFISMLHLTFESNMLNLCLGACHILM